jgi:hypothetical protein
LTTIARISCDHPAVTGHLQTVSVAAQFVRKRSFRIDPIHREHSWRGRDSGVEMKV